MNKTLYVTTILLISLVIYIHVYGQTPSSIPPPPSNVDMDKFDNDIFESLKTTMEEDIKRSGQTLTQEQNDAAFIKYVDAYKRKNSSAAKLVDEENIPLCFHGYVVDNSGNPLENALLQFSMTYSRAVGKTFLIRQEFSLPYELYTDTAGCFAMTDIICMKATITNIICEGTSKAIDDTSIITFCGYVDNDIVIKTQPQN